MRLKLYIFSLLYLIRLSFLSTGFLQFKGLVLRTRNLSARQSQYCAINCYKTIQSSCQSILSVYISVKSIGPECL